MAGLLFWGKAGLGLPFAPKSSSSLVVTWLVTMTGIEKASAMYLSSAASVASRSARLSELCEPNSLRMREAIESTMTRPNPAAMMASSRRCNLRRTTTGWGGVGRMGRAREGSVHRGGAG